MMPANLFQLRLLAPLLLAFGSATSALACSYRSGMDASEVKTELLGRTKQVSGSLTITGHLQTEDGGGFQVHDYEGVIVSTGGRRFKVAYQEGGVLQLCSPMTLPRVNASGTFFLKKKRVGVYELVHWLGSSSTPNDQGLDIR